jgi:hypothetical protein
MLAATIDLEEATFYRTIRRAPAARHPSTNIVIAHYYEQLERSENELNQPLIAVDSDVSYRQLGDPD